MSKRKRSPDRQQSIADDQLLRALREVADDALEEDVPDRLLQVIRAARRERGSNGEPTAVPDPAGPDQPA
jgi:hypothetical protein